MILRFHSFQFLYICCIYSSEDIENYLNYLKFIKIVINKFFKKKKKKELFDFSFGKQKIRHLVCAAILHPVVYFSPFYNRFLLLQSENQYPSALQSLVEKSRRMKHLENHS